MMAYEILHYMSQKESGEFRIYGFQVSYEQRIWKGGVYVFLENNEKDEVWWEVDGTSNLECITIVSYSILINKNSIENFTLLV